jgi:excinuclease UvrABC nuclease subunit
MLVLEELHLEDLPFVPLEDRQHLPSEPCVYLAIAKDRQILYVGKSENLKQRWKSHQQYQVLSAMTDVKMAYIRTEVELLHSLESALIQWYKPPLNTDGKKVRGIDALRKQAGLTQKQLANLVGVTESTIRNLERNRNGVEQIERIVKLCRALKCSPEDLIEYKSIEKDE